MLGERLARMEDAVRQESRTTREAIRQGVDALGRALTAAAPSRPATRSVETQTEWVAESTPAASSTLSSELEALRHRLEALESLQRSRSASPPSAGVDRRQSMRLVMRRILASEESVVPEESAVDRKRLHPPFARSLTTSGGDVDEGLDTEFVSVRKRRGPDTDFFWDD